MQSRIVQSACIAAAISSITGCYDEPTCVDFGIPCPGDEMPVVSDGARSIETATDDDTGVGGNAERGGEPEASPGPTGAGGARNQDAAPEVSIIPETGPADARSESVNRADAGDASACDLDGSPFTPACLQQYGVFVSPMGADTNSGDQLHPYATIAKGLSAAEGTNKRLFVCSVSAGDASAGETHDRGPDASAEGGVSADFVEAVHVGANHNGLRIIGGVDCSTWHPLRAGRKTRVIAPLGKTAIVIQNVSTGVVVENFEFEAPDAVELGGSSIAAFVSESAGVALRHVVLKAGMGKDGPPVALSSNYIDRVPLASSASGSNGGGQCITSCVNQANSLGGRGGSAPEEGIPEGGEDGTPGLGATGTTNGEGGAPGAACGTAGGGGNDGASALPAPGGEGARTYGRLDSNSWTPADGAPGTVGSPGQGGGGGSARVASSAGGGGGGGCGGCGGSGGPGGKGGGSSFALLSFQSQVSLENCTLSTQHGGAGSNGAHGQPGQTGGLPGAGVSPGCPGGLGGNGGHGGGGGGGAGGLSVAIAYLGPEPVRLNTTFYVVPARALGGEAGISGANATPATNGIDGVSEAVLSLAPPASD